MKDQGTVLDGQRASQGQSVALGDTGGGHAGVRSAEQGISNRRADQEQAAEPAGDGEDLTEPNDDEVDEDEGHEGAVDDQPEEDADDVTDPQAEPGKPI